MKILYTFYFQTNKLINLSLSDQALKLWDTETGQCIKRFENRKLAYCVKFNTSVDSSHLFLTGMADKKILCWDSRSGSIIQEYDRHLGAVNTINFVDGNRRFVSTSDDKVRFFVVVEQF